MIRSNRINHKHFNLFLDSKFGKNLLNGLLDVITGKGSTNNPLAQFIRENNAYKKAMSQQKKDEFMILKREPLTD